LQIPTLTNKVKFKEEKIQHMRQIAEPFGGRALFCSVMYLLIKKTKAPHSTYLWTNKQKKEKKKKKRKR